MSCQARRTSPALPWLAVLMAPLVALAGGLPKPLAATVQELRTISPGDAPFCGWPTLAPGADGHLLLAYSGGREAHVCPFGRVELMQSDDGGLTWSAPRVLLDTPLDDRDAGVLRTSRGSLLVTTFTSLAYEHPLAEARARPAGDPAAWPAGRLARWSAAQAALAEPQRQAALGQWVIRSTDNGANWSRPIPTLVNSPHGPIQLADGRLLYAGRELWTGGHRVGVCESRDDGATWQWLAEIPSRAGDDPAEYHELHVVQAVDGRLVCHIRNHNPRNQGETLQCESADGGRTWSVPRDIGVWGLPSHLLRRRDGSLLMTYGHRRQPFGNQARLSRDHGRTWSAPVTISAEDSPRDLGYPSTVELADGSLLTAWYEVMPGSPRAVLRQARWRLAE